jgi:hypothetical protein
MPFPSWLLNSRPVTSLAKGLMDKAIRPAIGRVVTNTIDPFSYDLKAKLQAIKANPGGAIKSVIQDKPLVPQDSWSESRDTPFRQMFGLKPRTGLDIYKNNPDGSLSFNQNTPGGLNNLKEVAQWAETNGHSTMGGFGKSYNPNTGQMQYFDKWDLGLNHGEVINKHQAIPNLARWFMDKVTKVPVIKGNLDFKGDAGRSLGKAVKFQGPGVEPYYEANTPGDLTRAIGLPQARFDAIRARIERGAEGLVERGSVPGLAREQSVNYNQLLDQKFRFLDKLKHVADLRKDHTHAGVSFNPDGVPTYMKSGPSLGDALIGGHDYANIGRYVKGVENVAPKLQKGFDMADRAITPMALAGGLTYGADQANQHMTPIEFL